MLFLSRLPNVKEFSEILLGQLKMLTKDNPYAISRVHGMTLIQGIGYVELAGLCLELANPAG